MDIVYLMILFANPPDPLFACPQSPQHQGSSVATSADRTLTLTHVASGTVLSDGGSYLAGAQYTVKLSSTSGHFMFEVNTDDFGGYTNSNPCSGTEGYTRINSRDLGAAGANNQPIVGPDDGSDLVVKAAWASSYGG